MRIPFRQGIVTAPSGFLQQTGSTVSLVIATPTMVSVAFADGTANYLHTERLSVTNAWTGPFAPGTDYWLYWDINIMTGQRTFGHTLHEPYEGASAPLSPQPDQHWFDTVSFKMKVWNATSGRWVSKIRVFAAKLQSGSVLISTSVNTPDYEGTQVGSVSAIPVAAGALVFDTNGDPVKRNNGTFFTTEDVVVASVASSTQVKLGATMIEAVAVANLPAYSIVQFVDFNQINLATTAFVEQGAYGIIEEAASTGQVVNVALQGVITNPAWDWTVAGVNAPLYVTNVGGLTTNVTPDGVIVAYVVDVNTIVLRPTLQTVSLYTNPDATLVVREEGSTVQTAVSALNFVGANVTASAGAAGVANITVTAPAATPLAVQEEGVAVDADVTTINFIGATTTAAPGAPGTVTVTVAAPTPLTVSEEGTPVDAAVTSINFVGLVTTATQGSPGSVTVTAATEPAIFTYTASQNMLATHRGAIVRFDNTTAMNYTIRTNANVPMPVGATIVVSQNGTGAVTIVPEGGVTIVTPETLITRKRWGKVTLTQTSADYWEAEGNLLAL
jgi:hypothetical protein